MNDNRHFGSSAARAVVPLRSPTGVPDIEPDPHARENAGASFGDFRQARIDPKRARRPASSQAEKDERASRLREMNCRYAVVREAGRTAVLYFDRFEDDEHAREVATFMSFNAFKEFHSNEAIRVGDSYVPLGHWWLGHRDRRQYDGLCFEPGAGDVISGRLNLWRGWGVEPRPGDWGRMRRHIREVLASGDPASDDYIIRWCAWAVQNPGRRAEAAIVFKGLPGTGKGTLGNALCRLFGQHGVHISSADQLAGRFNGHLRDACLLFADEAYWPGDKGAEGTLKRLITEPDLFIEAKGRDGIKTRNSLHVVMASNEGWIVPAGEDERRYVVFNVSAAKKQDARWFVPLREQMQAGGHAAMLHDLLAMDLQEWHPRQILRTAALREQQSRNLSPEDSWWVQLLETGTLSGADPREPHRAVSNGYEDRVDTAFGRETRRTKGLFDQAKETSPRLRNVTDHHLGRFLTERGCSNTRKVMRRSGWTFPPLAKLRADWEKRYPGWSWRDPDINDWWASGG